MERAHLWAAAQGASEVELTVYEFNEPARAFYENLGYETRSRQMYLSLEQGLR
jgi:ribosomal protein S18 acetylase RimI-like enzyme